MIKVCHPHDFDGFNYVVDGSDKLGGPLGGLVNEGLDITREYIAERGLNLSVIIQRSKIFNVTSPKSENYEGCLDALQSNQSDIYLGLADYPQAAENLSQGLIVLDTSLVIGSMYTKETAETSQVLSAFAGFSLSLWSMCLVSLLCLSLVLKARNSMARNRRHLNRYNFLRMATHMARLGSIDDRGFVRKLLFLAASLYSLVVVHYFCTSIKTGLVTIKDPELFRTYQDIIDRGALPTFAKGMFYDLMFKRPDAPSYRKKLWRYSVAKFPQDDLYTEFDPATFLLGSLPLMKQDSVIILDSLLMSLAPATGCPFAARDPARFLSLVNDMKTQSQSIVQLSNNKDSAQKFLDRFFERYPNFHYDSAPDFNFFSSVDPNEKYYTLGIIMSEHSAERLKALVRKSYMAAMQSGLMNVMRDKLKDFNMFKNFDFEMQMIFGKKNRSRYHLVEECASCEIIKPELNYHPLQLTNFNSLFQLMIGIVPLLFLVLAVEKFACRIKVKGRSITIDHTARKRKRNIIITTVSRVVKPRPSHVSANTKVAGIQNGVSEQFRAQQAHHQSSVIRNEAKFRRITTRGLISLSTSSNRYNNEK